LGGQLEVGWEFWKPILGGPQNGVYTRRGKKILGK